MQHIAGMADGMVTADQDLVVAGSPAMRGVLDIIKLKEDSLLSCFTPSFLAQVKGCEQLLVSAEYYPELDKSAAAAVWPVSEGGIMNALWNMMSAYGTGMDIRLRWIPVRQEAIEICEVFDINPYRLRSTGTFLLAADHGHDLCVALANKNIAATVIGKITPGIARRIQNDGGQSFLDKPQPDEIFKVLSR